MSRDPRLYPPEDQVSLDAPARIIAPVVDLPRGAGGPRDRQLVYGEAVTVLNRGAGHCLVRAAKDGYCGTVTAEALGPVSEATHRVTVRSTHAYAAPDIKSQDLLAMSFGSRLTALGETATFIETELGFVPRQHVHRACSEASDPAAVAEIFLGTPYLWGGNSFLGIDCSGLVQAACLACGIPCPGDSDMQLEALGEALAPDAALRRNDLLFWKGHVAIVTDAVTMLHTNAGYMSTVHEPIDEAIERISTQGDGLPVARKRLPEL